MRLDGPEYAEIPCEQRATKPRGPEALKPSCEIYGSPPSQLLWTSKALLYTNINLFTGLYRGKRSPACATGEKVKLDMEKPGKAVEVLL